MNAAPLSSRSSIFVPIALALLACGPKPNDAALAPDPQPDATSSDAHSFTVDIFDDFEDGDRDILPAGGRLGHWWNYDDASEGTSSIAVVALDPSTERHTTYLSVSTMALRVEASGYTIWGSGYSSTVSGGKAYDVSAYTGLILWAKSVSGRPSSIGVRIQDVNSDPAGGICNTASDASTDTACYDGFGQELDLTGEWQRYHLPFWSLRQLGFGLPVATGLATHQIYQIVFVNHAGIGYDYYLDDIGFYRE